MPTYQFITALSFEAKNEDEAYEKLVAYLRENGDCSNLDLWALDPFSGDDSVTIEDAHNFITFFNKK